MKKQFRRIVATMLTTSMAVTIMLPNIVQVAGASKGTEDVLETEEYLVVAKNDEALSNISEEYENLLENVLADTEQIEAENMAVVELTANEAKELNKDTDTLYVEKDIPMYGMSEKKEKTATEDEVSFEEIQCNLENARNTTIVTSEENIVDLIPDEVQELAQNSLEDIKELSEVYQNDFEIEIKRSDKITLGAPYVIVSLDEEEQDEIYYYPIMDELNNIILIATFCGTTESWNFSLTEEMVTQLNDIHYKGNDYIFIEDNNNIIAIDKKKRLICLNADDAFISKRVREFNLKSREKQIEEIKQKIEDNYDKFHISKKAGNQTDNYTCKFAINTVSDKLLELYNEQGQGSYGMCWAAAVATVVNYRKGKDISGQRVCKRMGIGYNDGADVNVAKKALEEYGVVYSRVDTKTNNSIMSWSAFKKNINNKYPVYVSTSSGNSGHAVTAVGYKNINRTNYLLIWNSGLNGGEGGYQVVHYSYSGTTYSYNNKTWIFQGSVSKYY